MQTVSEEKRKDISEREVRSENPRLLADGSRGIAKHDILDVIGLHPYPGQDEIWKYAAVVGATVQMNGEPDDQYSKRKLEAIENLRRCDERVTSHDSDVSFFSRIADGSIDVEPIDISKLAPTRWQRLISWLRRLTAANHGN